MGSGRGFCCSWPLVYVSTAAPAWSGCWSHSPAGAPSLAHPLSSRSCWASGLESAVWGCQGSVCSPRRPQGPGPTPYLCPVFPCLYDPHLQDWAGDPARPCPPCSTQAEHRVHRFSGWIKPGIMTHWKHGTSHLHTRGCCFMGAVSPPLPLLMGGTARLWPQPPWASRGQGWILGSPDPNLALKPWGPAWHGVRPGVSLLQLPLAQSVGLSQRGPQREVPAPQVLVLLWGPQKV